MKVAAYQAPLLAAGSMDGPKLIQEQVAWCETEGVSILCCPEAILGGLADYTESPTGFAIRTDNGEPRSILSGTTSDTVTVIVGFTELSAMGAIYNAAAVLHKGEVTGLYRKLHPAQRRSVYAPGSHIPVFRVDELVFGIVICNDSKYAEPARLIPPQGATALFIPTNNGVPTNRAKSCTRPEMRTFAGPPRTGFGLFARTLLGATTNSCRMALRKLGTLLGGLYSRQGFKASICLLRISTRRCHDEYLGNRL